MTLSNAAPSDSFALIDDKKCYLAPQTAKNTAETTGFQSLHYTDLTPNPNQALNNDEDEFGGAEVSNDPSVPSAGDLDVTGSFAVNSDLSQLPFWINGLMGAATLATDDHSWTSGKTELPLHTTLWQNPGVKDDEIRAQLISKMTMQFQTGSRFHKTQFEYLALDHITRENITPLAPADYTDPPTPRMKINDNAWILRVDGVAYDYWRTGSLSYDARLATESYIKPGNIRHGIFVDGPPIISGNIVLRFKDMQQIAGMTDPETPFAIEFENTFGATSNRILISLPQCYAPRPIQARDNRKFTHNIDFTAAGGASSAMTVSIKNGRATAY